MVPIENSSSATTSTSQLSDDAPRFTIRQYEPEDHTQVAKLIGDGLLHYALAGDPLHDFWVDYVQRSLASDVADISGHYLTPGSTFFVVTTTPATNPEDGAVASAEDAQKKASQPTIVATIAVKKQSDAVAELKRVSVKAAFRRFGIGRMLLSHVFAWAKSREYEKIVLSCTATQLQAIAFYESLGFTFVKRTVRLTDPYLELTHFEKDVL